MAETVSVNFIANTKDFRRNIRRASEEFRRDIQGLDRTTTASSKRIRAATQKIGDRTFGNTGKNISVLARTTTSLRSSLIGLSAAFLSVTAAAVGIRRTVTAVQEFGKAIGEVSTLVDTSVVSNRQLSETVLEISRVYGTGQIDTARALYQAISAGASAGAEANLLLEVAAKASIGGLTSLATSVKTLSVVLNAYGKDILEASTVSDKLFTIVKGGITTMEELSAFMAQAVPTAAALGISLDTVGASIATLTQSGVRTATAFEGLRSTIIALTAGTPELNNAFREIGFSSAQAAVRSLGFQGALQKVIQFSGGSAEQLRKLLGNVQAVSTVFSLTANNSATFSQQLLAMQNSAGAADVAFQKMQQTLDNRLNRATVRVNEAFIRLGEALLPIIIDATEGIGNFASAVARFAKDNPALIRGVVDAFILLGKAIALIVGYKFTRFLVGLIIPLATLRVSLLTASGAVSLAAVTMGGFATAILAATRASLAFIATPLGAALTAVTAIVGSALIGISKYADALANATVVSSNFVKLNTEQFDTLRDSFNQFRNSLFNANLLNDEEIAKSFALLKAGIGSGRIEFDRGIARAKAYAIELINANKSIINEEKNISDLRQQRSDELAKQRIANEQLVLKEQKKALNDRLTTLKEAISRSIEEEKRLLDAQKSFIDQARLSRLSTEDKIRELTRGTLTEEQQQADIRKEAATRLSEALTALSKGQFTEAQRLSQRVRTLATELDSTNDQILLVSETGKILERSFQRQALQAGRAARLERQRQGALSDNARDTQQTITDLDNSIKTLTDKDKTVTLTADIERAVTRLDDLKRQLDTIRDKDITVTVTTIEKQQRNAAATAGFKQGGLVRPPMSAIGLARGGQLSGFGGGDKVRALLEPGEFVMRKEAVRQVGSNVLAGINASKGFNASNNGPSVPSFKDGGSVTANTTISPLNRQEDTIKLELLIGNGAYQVSGARDQVSGLIEALSEASRSIR